jgi:hypothetical protein
VQLFSSYILALELLVPIFCSKMHALNVDEIFSRSLIVRLGMVFDHIHDSYKSAFSRVDQLSLACSSSFKKSLRKSWFRFTKASRSLRRNKEDGKNETDQNEENEI